MTTAKEICEGVSKSLLDSPVSDAHLADISYLMTDWQELSPQLDLTEVDVHDIVEAHPREPKLQRREALHMWREHSGDKATYRKLIVILCTHRRVRTAQFVKDLLTCKKSKCVLESDIVISEFSQELYEFYSDDSQHPSFLQWPFSTSHSYAELDLHTAPVVLDPSSGTNQPTKPVTLLSIFSGRKGTRKVVLLEGVAGSGKSTLCWYVSKEWSLRRLLQQMRLVIHVSVSDSMLLSAKTLADLIPHPSNDKREAVADAVANIQGEGVCFLFDGCDEAPHLFSRGSFLYQFVAGTGRRSKLSKVTILLTSRPGPAIPFELLRSVTEKVVIKGFKSLDKFIKDTVHEDSLKQKQIFEALDMKPELYSLCHLPLHAVILVYLFDFFKDRLPTTRTELFQPLVCNFLIRHMQTRTQHTSTTVIDNLSTDLPTDVHSSLCKLSKLAYQASLDRNVVISPAMLKDASIDPTCILSDTFGLLQVQHQLMMRGQCSMYEFTHLSLQEFLAAFHITQLDEHRQYTAFEKIFKRNPLSSILSFYAGLTELRLDSISDFLLQVVQKPFDLLSTVQALQASCEPATDIRRQLLSLMNCVYESQNVTVMDRISFQPQVLQDKVALASDFAKYNRSSSVEIELPFMNLYLTDCLSIGYFMCNAGNHMENSPATFLLNLSSCLLRTKDIKALCHELRKPARHPHMMICLNIRSVMLKTEAIQAICALIKRQPALYGLIITGIMTFDLRMALKLLIECLHSSSTVVYLSINDISYTPKPVVHHLILLLHFCTNITTLNLAGSSGVFRNPKATLLFCEAVKHCNLMRLFLDGCGIDDQKLLMLAGAITDRDCAGGLIHALDLGWNTYTSDGLTEFLKILVREAKYTILVMLATSLIVEEKHRQLVRMFNSERKKTHSRMFDLHIDCKNSNWQKEADCMKYLYKQPQLLKRD